MIFIILLIVLAILGMPLFAILASAGLYSSYASDLDPVILIIEMYRLANQPNLIAIPLFTLAGMTMAAGGAPQRLIKLFDALFGWMPGGLAIVTIVSCAFFTALTGASGVTIIALGGLLYPLFKQANYRDSFTTGLLTSSGSLGLLFPPSLAVILYGIISGVSIDELFLAGLVPSLILLILLSLYSYKSASEWQIKSHEFSISNLGNAIKASYWDLLLPIIIIVGIFGGILTITEAAAITAILSLFIEIIIYKELNIKKDLPTILIDTSTLVGSILIILGVAMGLTNLLIDSQLPMRLLQLVTDNITSQLHFLILLNIFLLAVGSIMDIFSAIIVVAPLVFPLARQFNIDPVHLGIIFLANLEIGYLTPPVGINLFIACQRFSISIFEIVRSTLPFLIIMIFWLMLISYLPSLSLWWQD
ncbi:MAG: TRAP transporter large permease subunit [Gammaproteobacteria bacterium]|nr:TRAP transporter large permease subunit [Gammaproteobacteria bacterium]